MRETNFINQNKKKWRAFEQILDQEHKDPDKLNELFVQITDDLSYSRTFYPNRSVRVYLNGLAQKIFFSIYKNRKSQYKRLLTFWTNELPLLVYDARRDFLISFLVFVFAILVGVLSSVMDPDFAQIILGQRYIDMTEANIEAGDPMAVYKDSEAFGMSIGITLNNLRVAFLTFVSGVLYGIGSIGVLITNGVMVGVFQYFFIERGLFWESFLTIWIHGTLEISAIIIAGAAGLTMGRGLAFPGTLTRLRSFQQSARRGLKIMVGITPIIILAGFIEGYLTRHTDTSDLFRLLFILFCLAFVMLYFVIYPRIKARTRDLKAVRPARLAPDNTYTLEVGMIKSTGEIFSDIFLVFRKCWRPLIAILFGGATVYTVGAFLLAGEAPQEVFFFDYEFLSTVRQINDFFVSEHLLWLPFFIIPLFSLVITLINRQVQKVIATEDRQVSYSWWQQWLRGMPAMAVLWVILWTNNFFTLFLLIFVMVLPLSWNYIVQTEQASWGQSFARTIFLIRSNYGRALGLVLILMLLGFLFFGLLDTALLNYYIDLINWVVPLQDDQLYNWDAILRVWTAMLVIFFVLEMIVIGFALLYYTMVEVREAADLSKRIEKIGQSSRIRGLERE